VDEIEKAMLALDDSDVQLCRPTKQALWQVELSSICLAGPNLSAHPRPIAQLTNQIPLSLISQLALERFDRYQKKVQRSSEQFFPKHAPSHIGARLERGGGAHSLIGIDETPLILSKHMSDQEGAISYLPQGNTFAQMSK